MPEDKIYLAIRAGKVVGKPCYSFSRLCQNLGVKSLKKSDLPFESNGLRIEVVEIDARV